jgi:hypothetical protein
MSLMDELAAACGRMICIDFDPREPVEERWSVRFEEGDEVVVVTASTADEAARAALERLSDCRGTQGTIDEVRRSEPLWPSSNCKRGRCLTYGACLDSGYCRGDG